MKELNHTELANVVGGASNASKTAFVANGYGGSAIQPNGDSAQNIKFPPQDSSVTGYHSLSLWY